LAKALYHYRRRVGRPWHVNEVFCFRDEQQRYLYQAMEQHEHVLDIWLWDKHACVSAEAVFRRVGHLIDAPLI